MENTLILSADNPIPQSDNLPVPPQIHEIELNNKESLQDEELNMHSTSHDPDIQDDQLLKLIQSELENLICYKRRRNLLDQSYSSAVFCKLIS